MTRKRKDKPNEKKLITEKDYKKRLKRALIVYGAFSLLIIPYYTITLALHADLIDSSLSYVGNSLGKRNSLILWTALTSIFFANFVTYILILTKNYSSRSKVVMYIACALLMVSNLIPFLPEVMPLTALGHELVAMSSAVLIAIAMFLLVISLKSFDHRIYKKALVMLCIIVFLSASLMFLFGVNSLLEIVAIGGLGILLFFILLWLPSSARYDGAAALRVSQMYKNNEITLEQLQLGSTTDDNIDA